MKFSFTGETKVWVDLTLRRISRTVNGVEETGGWIEKESNLDASSGAWVFGDAQVFGNAQVFGDAWVFGDALVFGNALVFVHDFSLYLRAPEDADVGYEDLFNWIVNDIPTGGSLRMLHTQIDTNCEPMDFYLPSARRNTVVISADGATFEYFEVPVRLIESYNP